MSSSAFISHNGVVYRLMSRQAYIMPHHGVLRSLRSVIQAIILSDAPLPPGVSSLSSRLFSANFASICPYKFFSLWQHVLCSPSAKTLPSMVVTTNLNPWAVRMLRVHSISMIERTWNSLRAARQCMCNIMQQRFRMLAQRRRPGPCEASSKWTMVFRTGAMEMVSWVYVIRAQGLKGILQTQLIYMRLGPSWSGSGELIDWLRSFAKPNQYAP